MFLFRRRSSRNCRRPCPTTESSSGPRSTSLFRVPKDRIQQRLAEQTIDETPDISLTEKIVERPVTQTQQAVNTDVQHVVNTVEAEMSVTQFNDKVADIPVVARREVSQLQHLDQVVDVPAVLVVEQVPHVHVVAKTAEIPQLQVTGKVTDVLVVSVVQVPRVWVVKKTVEDPQFEIVEKTVENPETRISDVVIDACLTCDAKCKVACETCVKDNCEKSYEQFVKCMKPEVAELLRFNTIQVRR